LINDLRYRLNDPTDTSITLAAKTRYLNRGIMAMFPRIYRTVRDSTLVIIEDTFEYTLPAAVGPYDILQVELETEDGSGRFRRGIEYEVIPDSESPILVFDTVAVPAEAGSAIRVTAMKPLATFTESVLLTETYTGPLGSDELPVLYAMGCIASVPLDDRLDYTQYSTAYVQGAPQAYDLMGASQFWFAQFELLLDRWAMPVPPING
jgi:hypothetical protein